MRNKFYSFVAVIFTMLSTPCFAQCLTTINGSLSTPDGSLSNRMNRNGIVNSCSSPKACSIFSNTGTFSYKVHTLVNATSSPQCVTATIGSPCATGTNNNLYLVAYLTSFDPTNICTNFLGDTGLSTGITDGTNTYLEKTFSFTVPANSTYLLVASDVNSGPSGIFGCNDYTITVQDFIPTNSLPTIASLWANGPIPCEGTTSLSGVANGSYFVFTGPNGYVFSNVFRQVSATNVFANNINLPGPYTLTVYSAGGCSTATATVMVDGSSCTNRSTPGLKTVLGDTKTRD